MRRNIILLICLACFPILLFSQSNSEERLQVHALAMEEDSFVLIRWAPANFKSWKWGMDNGFRLVRFTMGYDNVLDSLSIQLASKIVLDSVILPLPEGSWNTTNVDATQDQVDLAKGALYEPNFVIDSMIGESDLAKAYADQSDRESRYVFSLFAADQSFEVAKGLGLAFKDQDVDSNAIYFYSVQFLGEVDSSLLKNGGVRVNLLDDDDLPAPGEINVDQAIDSNILLVWDVSFLESTYSSYNIERSDDSLSFTQLNTLPLVSADQNGLNQSVVYYADTVQIGVDYFYRVKGVNSFGKAGPPSPVIKVRTHSSPKASPPKITSLELIDDEVVLEWDFPNGEEEDAISVFHIYRSKNALGPFTLLDSVASNIRTWTDPEPLTSGYYRVAAADTVGIDVSGADRLIQLDDETPPPVPESVACSVDASGLVTVTWAPVDDSGLRGYKVFSGSGEDGNYGEETKTPIKDTLFQFNVELQTLTKDLYIKVQSLDERENISDYSEPCHSTLPDKVAPSKPVLLNANPLATGVQLEWIHSASEDLDRHIVQRKRKVESGWSTILEISPAGTASNASGVSDVATDTAGGKLLDTLVTHTWEYQYRVVALDAAENKSASEVLTVQPYDSGLRGEITELEADTVFNFTQSSINFYKVELTWEYEALEGLYNFQIYRSVDGKPMRTYRTTNGRGGVNFSEVAQSQGIEQVTPGSFSWTDSDLGTGTIMQQSGYGTVSAGFSVRRTFKYQVMARHFDGGWSPVSEIVEIHLMVPKL